MQNLGNACKRLRLSLGVPVRDVAKATGFCVSSVYLFEEGHGSNIKILKWYLEHGLDASKITEEG